MGPSPSIPPPSPPGRLPFPTRGQLRVYKERRSGRTGRFGLPCLGGVPALSSLPSFFSAVPPVGRSVSRVVLGWGWGNWVGGLKVPWGILQGLGCFGSHPLKDYGEEVGDSQFSFFCPVSLSFPQTSIWDPKVANEKYPQGGTY